MGHVVASESTEKIAEGMHAVIVPFPAQGHVTPSLQLARKLIRLGFKITFVNTTDNHDRIMASQAEALKSEPENIMFVAVPDGLPDDYPRWADMKGFSEVIMKMGPTFEDLFARIMVDSPIACLIRDTTMTCVHDAARKLKIPEVVFSTPSAIAFHCCNNIPNFIANGILPLPPPPDPSLPSLHPVTLFLRPPQSIEEAEVRRRPLTCLPGTPKDIMRVEDIPTILLSDRLDGFFLRFLNRQRERNPKCACILLNTFYELEADVIDAMSQNINPNIYPIGPLVLTPGPCETEPSLAGAGSALWKEDPKALSWLDDQKPKSVLYVSFGSLATISIEQIRELAHGLEMSQQRFLWVIRSDQLVRNFNGNKEFQSMFTGFVERTRDQALLIPWVPQTEVLSHPSVGAFLTHCGWNSTIEGISCGVPMLTWPRFSDQTTNARYITHVWKVGLGVDHQGQDGLVSKEEVSQKVRRIMAKDGEDLEVDLIRNKSRELRSASRKAVQHGGTSHKALLNFVEHIRQMRGDD